MDLISNGVNKDVPFGALTTNDPSVVSKLSVRKGDGANPNLLAYSDPDTVGKIITTERLATVAALLRRGDVYGAGAHSSVAGHHHRMHCNAAYTAASAFVLET